MATRGFEHVTLADVLARQARTGPKPSKYRNVRVVVDGHTFASKREAAYYQGLKARQHTGEIRNLRCQVPFPLLAPTVRPGVLVQVAEYLADFVYDEGDEQHVIDVKGHRTAIYALKAKWLFLQTGLAIEEV